MLLVGVVDTDGLCDGLLELVCVGDVVLPSLAPLGINDVDGFNDGMLVSTAALG